MEQEPPVGAVRLRGRAHADARERSHRERAGAAARRRRSGRAGSRACARRHWWSRPAARASAVCVPIRPHAASFSVPSPASTTTTSMPTSAASRASLVASPRCPVSMTSTSCSAASDRVIGRACARRDARSDRVDDQLEAHGAEPYPYDPAVPGTSTDQLRALTDEIVACRACPRLVEWRERVATEKRASFRDETYWGRPVPGFGDPQARVLIAGLAPAAHGGNRTGRVFTGDRSGDWLFALVASTRLREPADVGVGRTTGSSCTTRTSRPRCGARRRTTSRRPKSATGACRTSNASSALLERVRVVVVLGGFAYEALARVLAACGSPLPVPRPKFAHGLEVATERFVVLGCYHPSQQNTFTRRLTEPMIDDVFRRARELADGIPSTPCPSGCCKGSMSRSSPRSRPTDPSPSTRSTVCATSTSTPAAPGSWRSAPPESRRRWKPTSSRPSSTAAPPPATSGARS